MSERLDVDPVESWKLWRCKHGLGFSHICEASQTVMCDPRPIRVVPQAALEAVSDKLAQAHGALERLEQAIYAHRAAKTSEAVIRDPAAFERWVKKRDRRLYAAAEAAPSSALKSRQLRAP